MTEINFEDLGLIEFNDAWQYQEKLFKASVDAKIKNRTLPDDEKIPASHHVLFCEHYPVITLGKSGDEKNILLNNDFLLQKGIKLYHINRGGDATFHGPGQIVGYPILDLDFFYTDIGRYLRNIEEVIIRTVADYNIHAERLPGATGVWIDAADKLHARKICAIGIRCSRWITMHGFAFNINTDLNYFNYIIPCGIQDKSVTSLQKELNKKIDMHDVKQRLQFYFEKVFNCKFMHALAK